MAVLTSFETFRKALEIDPGTLACARDLHETARAALRDLPGWKRDFLSGSYARNTRLDPLNDIDIVVVVEDTSVWDNDPDAAVTAAGETVRPEFPGCRIRKGAHAAKVMPKDPPIEGVHLDVVVAREAGWGTVLEISEREPEAKWRLSDPEAHASALSLANVAWKQRLVPLIKQIKHWNRTTSGEALKSFHVEALALRVFVGAGDLPAPEMVQRFFQDAKAMILTPTSSPAVPDGFVDGGMPPEERSAHAARLSKASKAADDAIAAATTDEAAAEDIWHGLFGDPFPKPDEAARKAAIAEALKAGTAGIASATFVVGGGRPIAPTRSFGGGHE
jgi:hypothetical protein